MLPFFKSTKPAGKRSPIFARDRLPVYVWRPKEEGYQNFGDELTSLLAVRIAHLNGIEIRIGDPIPGKPKLLGVGSVLHQGRNGDVVWGSGVNGKNWPRNLTENRELDIRAVRGPLTHRVLTQFGVSAPEIYGDPGLLFPELFKDEIRLECEAVSRKYGELNTIFIPNLNDDRFMPKIERSDVKTVSPSETPFRMAQIISRAKLVLSSSLHGIVFADALGVPCRPVLSAFEPAFKYADYFAGTGRHRVSLGSDLDEALGKPDIPTAVWDRDALVKSFPIDLIA